MILTFMIIFVVASVWDVSRINRVLDNTINPGRRTQYR